MKLHRNMQRQKKLLKMPLVLLPKKQRVKQQAMAMVTIPVATTVQAA